MAYTVGVVGLGKLGTPLALLIADAGHIVYGIDLDIKRVRDLSNKQVLDPEPGVREILGKPNLQIEFATDFRAIELVDLVYVIVPTPSLESGHFSNEYLISALREIGKTMGKNSEEQLVVVVSTVMPGSTSTVLKDALYSNIPNAHQSKKKLIYSPEFIALGSVVRNLQYPDIVLVGSDSRDDASSHLAVTLSLSKNSPEVKVLTVKEAELVKLAINTYVTMKISFANFIGEISRSVEGIDASKVCEAIGQDSRIGAKYLSPGLGFGGPCFPRDNRAFSEFASSINLNADLAIATESINRRLPANISSWIKNEYPDKKRIAILGITYKENSEVIEESQSIIIANQLDQLGYLVLVHDPLLNKKPINLGHMIKFTNDLSDIYECDLALKTINWDPYSKIDSQLIDVVNLR